MKINYIYIILIVISIFSCQSVNDTSNYHKVSTIKYQNIEIENSSKYFENATAKAKQLISENRYTSFDTLHVQKLDRLEKNSEVIVNKTISALKTGNEIYNHLKERTLFVGGAYLCNKCPNTHLTSASGFVIQEDGIVVTNYHVIDPNKNLNVSAYFVSDHEGNVYPVSKVLSSSKLNDIVVMQIDTQGKKLKTLELAEEELMGEDVVMMGHPFSNTFFMSTGIMARKYLDRNNMTKIAITADFGQGASGGPVVNSFGEVVGVVSKTYSHYAGGSKDRKLQMVVKEVIPVSVLDNYIRKN